MVIFHSYVSLPEGKWNVNGCKWCNWVEVHCILVMLRAVICLWALGFVSWLGMTVQFRLQRSFLPVCWLFASDTTCITLGEHLWDFLSQCAWHRQEATAHEHYTPFPNGGTKSNRLTSSLQPFTNQHPKNLPCHGDPRAARAIPQSGKEMRLDRRRSIALYSE